MLGLEENLYAYSGVVAGLPTWCAHAEVVPAAAVEFMGSAMVAAGKGVVKTCGDQGPAATTMLRH
jgi:hypothetical protein